MSLKVEESSKRVFVSGGWRSPSRGRLAWRSERRGEYLLREVDVPFSYDERVLPLAAHDAAELDDVELIVQIMAPPGSDHILASWRLGETFDALPERPSGWTMIGYDVCDEAGYSGLMNCAPYSRAERMRRLAKWSGLLNEVHLFDSPEYADAFRMEMDVHVPEHAPFLVHSLYLSGRRHLSGRRR